MSMWDRFDWGVFFDGLVFDYWSANLRVDLTDCRAADLHEGAD